MSPAFTPTSSFWRIEEANLHDAGPPAKGDGTVWQMALVNRVARRGVARSNGGIAAIVVGKVWGLSWGGIDDPRIWASGGLDVDTQVQVFPSIDVGSGARTSEPVFLTGRCDGWMASGRVQRFLCALVPSFP